jgi:uncharacterized HAD superfamily protein
MPKPASKPVIAVDIDDVLSAHAEAFVEYSNKKWGTNLTPDDYDEDWAKLWKIDQQELEKRSRALFANDIVSSYKHIPDSDSALKELAKNHKLVIITSRRKWISKETTAWLDKYYPKLFSEVHFAGIWDDLEKSSVEKINITKGDIARQIGANYLIDDQPKHCAAAAEAGITGIIFGDYSWNRDFELKPGMVRARTWQEVLEYFDGRS